MLQVVAGRQLYIGNLGDCRVVVSRAGEAFLLTQDHTPTRYRALLGGSCALLQLCRAPFAQP